MDEQAFDEGERFVEGALVACILSLAFFWIPLLVVVTL